MAENNYILPPIGTKGKFTFKAPFDDKLENSIEYEVTSIRSLKEIFDSEEDPYKNIYEPVEIPEEEFKTDMDNNMSIVILKHGNNIYTYVPANRLNAIPDISGVKYRERMLAITLGYIPLDMDIEAAKEAIKESILEITGITSTVEEVNTSATIVIADEKHKEYMLLLAGKKKNYVGYRYRYKILGIEYEDLKKKNAMLEAYISTTICPLIESGKLDNRPFGDREEVDEDILEEDEDTFVEDLGDTL